MLIQKGSDMSLNKHKIIPLIESYYHTFTPLEKNIADFFIHNTDEHEGEFNIYGIIMDAKNFVRLIMFVRLMGRVILI